MKYQNIHKKILILTRGLPGSGKSYLAEQLKGDKGIIHSTDNYFMVNGIYQFDSKKLSENHQKNLQDAFISMLKGINPIVIDNTHTQGWEAQKYYHFAIKCGYKVIVKQPETDWKFNTGECAKRNSHGVSEAVIRMMLKRFENDEEFNIAMTMRYDSLFSKDFWLNVFTGSTKPSSVLKQMQRDNELDDIFNKLSNIRQSKKYHPEGDVFEHTCQVLDCAVEIAKRENLKSFEKKVLILSALLHDIGKLFTTKITTDTNGEEKITSYEHEAMGARICPDWLNSWGCDNELIVHIVPLVKYHLAYINADTIDNSKIIELSKKLLPSNYKMLFLLIEADHSGRKVKGEPMTLKLEDKARLFKDKTLQLNCFERYTGDIKTKISGKDIIENFPDIDKTTIGSLIAQCKKFETKEEALEWIKNNTNN